MTDVERRTELAGFLKTRRAALTPSDVGLPSGSRRRTPGLRREEVATLADVGVTWYTFLEQGRPIKMSADALQRVAMALRLAPQEVEHLFLLAGRTPPGPEDGAEEPLPDALVDFITGFGESPAWAVTPSYDVVAWNRAAARVWIDLATVPPAYRNLLWLLYCDPRPRMLHDDWESNAHSMVAAFRARLAEHQGDPEMTNLADRLHAASPEFRQQWSSHDVVYQRSLTMDFTHPAVGALRFSATTVRPEAAPRLRVLIWTPDPATDTRVKVRSLIGAVPG